MAFCTPPLSATLRRFSRDCRAAAAAAVGGAERRRQLARAGAAGRQKACLGDDYSRLIWVEYRLWFEV